jgi:hypothetical protein
MAERTFGKSMGRSRASTLTFSIASASSQSDQYPATNLINASPYSQGWISAPNCPLPQELVLDFGGIVSLSQLQFVSHQSKIAANLTLSTSRDSGWRSAKFQRIDSFQFSDNRQREYKARELRVANLPGLKLHYLKLAVDQIHPNRLNRDHQVGLISITATGSSDFPESEDTEVTRLERDKQLAVESQDYMLAHQIKLQIQALQANRQQLADLERQKAEAIRADDMERAHHVQQEIISLQTGKRSTRPPKKPAISAAEPTDVPVRRKASRPAPEPVSDPEPGPPPTTDTGDSRPICPGKGGRYNFEDEIDDDLLEKPEADYRRKPKSKGKRSKKVDDLLEFPENKQVETDPVEDLDPRDRQESELLIEAFGEEPVRLFYSKTGANKVNGIRDITDAIQRCRMNHRPPLFVKFCHLLRLRLREELIGVFTAAISAIMTLSDNLRLSADVIRNSVEPHLGLIIGKLGDKKQQIGAAAKDFVIWAAESDAIGIPMIAPHLIAPLKKPVSWTNVQERLGVINDLLEKYGEVDPAFEVQAIVHFAFVTLDSKPAGVRHAACQVCKALAGMGYASQILKMLQASSLNPQTQNAVRQAISK